MYGHGDGRIQYDKTYFRSYRSDVACLHQIIHSDLSVSPWESVSSQHLLAEAHLNDAVPTRRCRIERSLQGCVGSALEKISHASRRSMACSNEACVFDIDSRIVELLRHRRNCVYLLVIGLSRHWVGRRAC